MIFSEFLSAPPFQFLAICLLRIFLSFLAGFFLGLERKFRAQVVGMRTLILISEASTLLGILSIHMAHNINGDGGDTTRIAASVVSGIGFLGGGAIMRQGLNIKGLTSAAIIWITSSIGLAIGGGLYIPAFATLGISILSLIWLEKVEIKWFPAGRTKSLHLTFDDSNVDMKKLRTAIESNGFIIADFNMSHMIESSQLVLHYSVKSPQVEDFSKLIEDLNQVGNLEEFSITD